MPEEINSGWFIKGQAFAKGHGDLMRPASSSGGKLESRSGP